MQEVESVLVEGRQTRQRVWYAADLAAITWIPEVGHGRLPVRLNVAGPKGDFGRLCHERPHRLSAIGPTTPRMRLSGSTTRLVARDKCGPASLRFSCEKRQV